MQFLKFLLIVVLAVGGIYWKNNTNISNTYDYFKAHGCEDVVLYRAEYKAACKEKVIIIDDFFFVDFEDNREFLYKDISSAEQVGHIVILHNKEVELNEAEPRVYFGKLEQAKRFQETVNSRLK